MRNPDAVDRPLRADARASRAALLEAARQLMAELGPEGLTVVAVAQRAGLNRSTAYQHFRSREDLLAAVLGAIADELRSLLGRTREFGEQIDFFVDYFGAHPEIARNWIFQLLADGDSEGEVPGWNVYVAGMQRLADSGRSQDGIDAEMLAFIAVSSALAWSLQARRAGGKERVQRATGRFSTELKRLFLHGALRPEHWPDLAADLLRASAAEGRSDPAPS